jgi:hypothetical protein
MSDMPFIPSSGGSVEDGHNRDVDQAFAALHTKLTEALRSGVSARAQAGQYRRERDEARKEARRLRDVLLALSTDAGAGSSLADKIHRAVYGDSYRKGNR